MIWPSLSCWTWESQWWWRSSVRSPPAVSSWLVSCTPAWPAEARISVTERLGRTCGSMKRLAGGWMVRRLCWTSVRRRETPGHFSCSRSHCGNPPSVSPRPGSLVCSPPSRVVVGGGEGGGGEGDVGGGEVGGDGGGDSSDIQEGRQSWSMRAADRRTALLVAESEESGERRADYWRDSGLECSCLRRDICSAEFLWTRGTNTRWSFSGETPGIL